MKDIKQRIEKILEESYHDEVSTTPYVNKLIEEVIKPIAKEAFEAGEVYGKAELTDSVNVRFSTPTFEEWINENLK